MTGRGILPLTWGKMHRGASYPRYTGHLAPYARHHITDILKILRYAWECR